MNKDDIITPAFAKKSTYPKRFNSTLKQMAGASVGGLLLICLLNLSLNKNRHYIYYSSRQSIMSL